MEGILNRIKEIRTAKKISQDQISKHLGITQAAYAKVESGDSITVDRLYKIAEILNVSIGDLLRIEVSENKSKEDELKAEIERLKEIINDKRTIIDFLSKNNLLLAVASQLYHDENPDRIRFRNFNDTDSLLKELDEMPYDPGDPQSQYLYILKRMDELKNGKKA